MYYYDTNDRKPRRWAILAALVYAVLLGVSFVWVSFDFESRKLPRNDEVLIEFIPEPEPEPTPPPKAPAEPRVHEQPDVEERVEQASGKAEEVRTPNPKALFKMAKSGADEPVNGGNPHAKEGEEKSKGKGSGLNADGLDHLDKGLQGRGLVGALPRPDYPGTKSGKVVVRVTVGSAGDVTSASFEPKGSTTNDAQLIDAALRAARKARFTQNNAPVQWGTITYVFRTVE